MQFPGIERYQSYIIPSQVTRESMYTAVILLPVLIVAITAADKGATFEKARKRNVSPVK